MSYIYSIIKNIYFRIILRLYDILTSKTVTLNVGDIMNQRSSVEHNQFLMAARFLDIEDFCENGIMSFDRQNIISRKTYGEKHNEERGNNSFKKIIESYKMRGYDPASILTVDEDIVLMDGNHRMGMNLYIGVDKIHVRVLKRKSHIPKNIDWYLIVGLDTAFINSILDAVTRIQDKLVEMGNVFCAILPNKDLVKDISCLVNIKAVNEFKQIINKTESICLPSTGFLVRFTHNDPDYFLSNKKVYSRRSMEIENILKKRYNGEIIIAKNCMEGKALYDHIKNCLVK